ncbi:MAG: pyruvate kinase [Spirochaetales bacterium]|nr:pyruvate kinase [Spirochaetales bacterium]
MNKVKILCTIGPSCSSYEKLTALVNAGMNVARLNFSHGTYEDHGIIINLIKRIREETGKNIGILQDLSGPKIRVGSLPEDKLVLETNMQVKLVVGDTYSHEMGIHHIPVKYDYLLQDTKAGARLLLDDGYIELLIEKKESDALVCRVKDGGILKSHKGLNFPGQVLTGKAPTKKDLEDLAFGIKNNVDFVALSFVQTKEDILELKKEIKRLGGSAFVIAKIERDTAITELDAIVKATDGVMVARGDLGIECELSMIPIYQKQITRICNLNAKPVIIATQMLESMIKNPLPTRAEVTDVANAIYDGSDAIMLSAETAVGDYPVQAVHMMRRIADNVEKNLWLDRGWVRDERPKIHVNPELAVAESICNSAQEMEAAFIIANTMSGRTARLVSMFRPRTEVIAMTPVLATFYQLSLVWGLKTLYDKELNSDFMSMVKKDEELLLAEGCVKKGDHIVVSAGIPHSIPGKTNIMKLHTIGESGSDENEC